MASMIKPLIATFECDGVIAKGQAVKIGSTNKRVAVVAATTDLSIGVAQNATVNVGDLVEVAMPGGGAKGLANASWVAGDILGHNENGALQKLANANDKIIGQAMNAASANDLCEIIVISAQGVATQS